MSSVTIFIQDAIRNISQQQKFTQDQITQIPQFLNSFLEPENVLAVLSPFTNTEINYVVASREKIPYQPIIFSIKINEDRNIVARAAHEATTASPQLSNTAEQIKVMIDEYGWGGRAPREINPEALIFSAEPFKRSSLSGLICRSSNLGFEYILSKI